MATVLHLSCKQTETHRKLRDIINSVYYAIHSKNLEINQTFWDLKEAITTFELVLLRILKFNTHVFLPHSYLLLICHQLHKDESKYNSSWNLSLYRQTVELALALASDLFQFSDLCFVSEQQSLERDHAWNCALACVCLSLEFLKIKQNHSFKDWCRAWGSQETPESVLSLCQSFLKKIVQNHHQSSSHEKQE